MLKLILDPCLNATHYITLDLTQIESEVLLFSWLIVAWNIC